MRGDMQDAKLRAEALVAETEALPGLGDDAKLGTKRLLFQLLIVVGDREAADKLAKEIAETETRIADLGDIDALTDQFLLMQMSLSNSFDIGSVAPVIERAAEVFAKKLGENSVMMLQAQSYLLTVMAIKRDPQTGKFAEDLTARLERVYGPNNPATFEARGSEAQSLLWLGESQRAVQILEEVVPAYEKVLGPKHRRYLS